MSNNNDSKPTRKYGFACSNCRRRKARCNGALPACQKCLANHETCSYNNKGPSVAYVASLQDQLQAYKDRFEELRLAKDEERGALLTEPISTKRPNGGRSRVIQSPPATDDSQLSENAPMDSVDDTIETASVGADGRVCFYGKTSLYHMDTKDHSVDDHTIAEYQTGAEEQSPNITSISPSYFRCHDTSALLTEISPTLLNDLLDTYWCYPHHLHCVLCKPLFLRDLYASGPCITPFLLCAVLAQAARYSTRPDAVEVGHHFADRALKCIPGDIDREGSSIPTLQGLLIFSARECACGRVSQGWLYSGMAFRMMRDLGIDVSPRKLGQLAAKRKQVFTEEDLALRRQVFWSCYTWDKTMSVCLGRAAAVPCTVEPPTQDTLPFGQEADNETWQPTTVANTRNSSFTGGLLEQKALSSTRFIAYCELCVITESVLDELYSRPHGGRHHQLLEYLDSTLRKLRSWAERLPSEIFIKEATRRTLVCPPLHILVLNLMYHTVTILLCRPYRTTQRAAKEQCTKASQMIDALFILHVKRLGFRFITYLQTYTMFVACTINVLDFTENETPSDSDSTVEGDDEERLTLAQEAKSRLYFGLEVLRQANSTPSAARCAAVIAQLLQKQQRTFHQDGEPHAGQDEAVGTAVCSSSAMGLGVEADIQKNIQRQPRPLKEPAAMNLPFVTPSHLPSTSGNGQAGLTIASTITSPPIEDVQETETGFTPLCPIEQPLKWLPENVVDDGSWMLMMDVDLEGGFSFTPPTGFS